MLIELTKKLVCNIHPVDIHGITVKMSFFIHLITLNAICIYLTAIIIGYRTAAVYRSMKDIPEELTIKSNTHANAYTWRVARGNKRRIGNVTVGRSYAGESIYN